MAVNVRLVQFKEVGGRFKIIRVSDGARLQATIPYASWQVGGLHAGDFITRATDYSAAKQEVESRFNFVVVE